MSTTRTPINRPPKSRITAEAVEVYRKAREIFDAFDNRLEAASATRELRLELNRLLGRNKPWLVGIFDTVDVDRPPPYERHRVEDWHEAHEIRLALDRAAGMES